MKTPDSKSTPSPDDMDRHLSSQVRATSPDFEKRFDALVRRLNTEEAKPQSGVYEWIKLHLFPTWVPVGTFAALALIVFISWPRTPHLDDKEISKYGELLTLDATLKEALPLTDAETLQALLSLSKIPNGDSL
jgi:hypothetical protein